MSFNNDLIITAMDRFVWFVLLVVTTHLVTELTRVTGHNRANRKDVNAANDSLIVPINVENSIRFPGQQPDLYEKLDYSNKNQKEGETIDQNNNNNNNNNEHGISFSVRPLIDSIFKLPISTLHTVHNLFGRLASNQQQEQQQQVTDSSDGSAKLKHRSFQAMSSAADHPTSKKAKSAEAASSSSSLASTMTMREPLLRECSA